MTDEYACNGRSHERHQTLKETLVAGIHGHRPETIDIPTSLTVASLADALALVGRTGGTITSETRTAPGIGSWEFVVDREGRELVLWETAAPVG